MHDESVSESERTVLETLKAEGRPATLGELAECPALVELGRPQLAMTLRGLKAPGLTASEQDATRGEVWIETNRANDALDAS